MDNNYIRQNLAKKIDHTLLKPNIEIKQVESFCNEALEHEFASVCLFSYFLDFAHKVLIGSKVKLSTVVGFPFGTESVAVKLKEAEIAFERSANEIDMVMNIPAFINKKYALVYQDILKVTELAHYSNAKCKVIVETCLLNESQKKDICRIISDTGADYIKTSTGFSKAGANLEDVKLFKSLLDPKIKIKASGGINNLDFALELIAAGANRLGTSSAVKIIEQANFLN